MYFSAVDILKACGIKAPTKWMERNTSDRPDIVTAKFEYPVKTTQGYRRVKLNFVTGGVGKRLVKYTTCRKRQRNGSWKKCLHIVPPRQAEHRKKMSLLLKRRKPLPKRRRTSAGESTASCLSFLKLSGLWRRARAVFNIENVYIGKYFIKSLKTY